jgi:hypothetical protein
MKFPVPYALNQGGDRIRDPGVGIQFIYDTEVADSLSDFVRICVNSELVFLEWRVPGVTPFPPGAKDFSERRLVVEANGRGVEGEQPLPLVEEGLEVLPCGF